MKDNGDAWKWKEYERQKRVLIASNPTQEEYERGIKQIVRELGL
jgi:hypothetical protein